MRRKKANKESDVTTLGIALCVILAIALTVGNIYGDSITKMLIGR